MQLVFVLIQSPLVGGFTWSRVKAEMQKRGLSIIAPRLHDDGSAPYWKQHAESVARALDETPQEAHAILVGHSGAGPLLPAIGAHSPRPVAGYVFVDAGILWRDASRLEMMGTENVEWAREFEKELKRGGSFPNWSADDLREIIPDAETREALARDLRPRSLPFFQETLPAFGFPDLPCAYLQFSRVYDTPALQAQEHGWAFESIDAGHFHMLVAPADVTDAIVALTRDMRAEDTE